MSLLGSQPNPAGASQQKLEVAQRRLGEPHRLAQLLEAQGVPEARILATALERHAEQSDLKLGNLLTELEEWGNTHTHAGSGGSGPGGGPYSLGNVSLLSDVNDTLFLFDSETGGADGSIEVGDPLADDILGAPDSDYYGHIYYGMGRKIRKQKHDLSVIWEVDHSFTDDVYAVAARKDGTTLAVNANGSEVALVDGADGSIIWRTAGGEGGRVAICPDTGYVLSSHALAARVHDTAGNAVWTSPEGLSASTSLWIDEQRYILGHADGLLECFDRATGASVWAFSNLSPSTNPRPEELIVDSYGNLYAYFMGSGDILCIDPADGSVLWTFDAAAGESSGPEANWMSLGPDHATLYFKPAQAGSHSFGKLDLATQEVLWQTQDSAYDHAFRPLEFIDGGVGYGDPSAVFATDDRPVDPEERTVWVNPVEGGGVWSYTGTDWVRADDAAAGTDAVATHEAAADPHAGYRLESEPLTLVSPDGTIWELQVDDTGALSTVRA